MLLEHYYAAHYFKLIQQENFTKPEIIPSTWFKYATQSVDTNTKREAVKNLITKWIDWERSTKKFY
jgi:negative regulator of replication initiation